MTFWLTGHGSSVHLAGELFKMRAGIDVLHVPYRGGAPAVTALLAGEIDMLLIDVPVVVSHIQSGAFKALGVASEQRSSILSNVPTVIEAGIPGVIAEGWYAMYAPAGTPAAIVSALQDAIGDVLAQAPIVQAIAGFRGNRSDEFCRVAYGLSTRRIRQVGRGGPRLRRQDELIGAIGGPAGFRKRSSRPARERWEWPSQKHRFRPATFSLKTARFWACRPARENVDLMWIWPTLAAMF